MSPNSVQELTAWLQNCLRSGNVPVRWDAMTVKNGIEWTYLNTLHAKNFERLNTIEHI